MRQANLFAGKDLERGALANAVRSDKTGTEIESKDEPIAMQVHTQAPLQVGAWEGDGA